MRESILLQRIVYRAIPCKYNAIMWKQMRLKFEGNAAINYVVA